MHTQKKKSLPFSANVFILKDGAVKKTQCRALLLNPRQRHINKPLIF